jgi:hypothetical protein
MSSKWLNVYKTVEREGDGKKNKDSVPHVRHFEGLYKGIYQFLSVALYAKWEFSLMLRSKNIGSRAEENILSKNMEM